MFIKNWPFSVEALQYAVYATVDGKVSFSFMALIRNKLASQNLNSSQNMLSTMYKWYHDRPSFII